MLRVEVPVHLGENRQRLVEAFDHKLIARIPS